MKNKSSAYLLANSIGTLFHPLTITLWAVAIVLLGDATSVKYIPKLKSFVMWSVAGMTLATPLLFGVILRWFGDQKANYNAPKNRNRAMMLVAMELCLLGCGSVFQKFAMLFVIRKLLYTAAIVVLILIIFEIFWPLCHHTTAIGALLGVEWTLLYVGNVNLLWPFIATIVVGGTMCSAQLILHKQPAARIYVGGVIGLALGLTTFILF